MIIMIIMITIMIIISNINQPLHAGNHSATVPMVKELH